MPENEKVKVAAIVGSHPYDVVNFQRMFESMEGVECYIQHLEMFVTSDKERRQWYDVVLFYNMHWGIPADSENWAEGKVRTALDELGETEQGIFMLHHAILAYAEWDKWSEICGIGKRGFDYHLDQTVELKIADKNHPITSGLSDFTLGDETYTMDNAGEGSHILITADHPQSMETIAWVRQYKASPVFCFASGHDNSAFANENFRKVARQAIKWLAERKRGRANP